MIYYNLFSSPNVLESETLMRVTGIAPDVGVWR